MADEAGRRADVGSWTGADGDHPSVAVAKRLVAAVAARDDDGVIAILSPDARLRSLTPSGPSEIGGAAQVAAKFRGWFGDADVLEMKSILVEPLADRLSARYRFVLDRGNGWEVIEQQTYLDVDEGGAIAAIDLLCSGFRPDGDLEEARSPGTHRFDAGDLGCADGLAAEFRGGSEPIPVGRRARGDGPGPRCEGRPAAAGPDDGPRGSFGRRARRSVRS